MSMYIRIDNPEKYSEIINDLKNQIPSEDCIVYDSAMSLYVDVEIEWRIDNIYNDSDDYMLNPNFKQEYFNEIVNDINYDNLIDWDYLDSVSRDSIIKVNEEKKHEDNKK